MLTFFRKRVVPAVGGIALLWLGSGAVYATPDDEFRAGTDAYRGGDVIEAMSLLRKPADQGHAPSQALLAYILDKAEFDDQALAYYRKAAAQGNAEGEFGLGSMYAAGEGVTRDFAQARKWITLAAEQGHPPAINALATAYVEGGLGIGESERGGAEALRWLRRSADSGHLPAMIRLASAYRSGSYGLDIDPRQAEAFEVKVRAAQGAAEKGRARNRGKK